MNNTERFTDKEWEELASILSDEKGENKDLLSRFQAEDLNKTSSQWKEIGSLGNNREIDTDKAWNNLNSRLKADMSGNMEKTAPVYFLRSTFLRVAAFILVLISLGSVAVYMNYSGYFSKKITASTGDDQKNLVIDLPDGSKITLNRNSEFTYRADFGKHKRNVSLSGEAFFEIAPDASRPFIIDAGKAKVRVVGTSFNVITQNVESAVEVYVKTGKVMLSDKSGSTSLLLEPGDIGKMDSRKSDKTINKDPNYLSWKSGLLVYTGQTLDVVFKDLKRVYNIDIIVDDNSILENPLNSTIGSDNESQETIITMICISFNLSYTKDGNVYHLSKK